MPPKMADNKNMPYRKPSGESSVRNIKVLYEPEVRKNKNNKDYIWVKESKEVSWYCDIRELFPHFHEDLVVKCLVSEVPSREDGKPPFRSIVDVVDESFEQQRASLPVSSPAKSNGEKQKEEVDLKHELELIKAMLAKLGKLVAEVHDKIYQSEELPDLKTDFPPKER
jgi:hypothetical protein